MKSFNPGDVLEKKRRGKITNILHHSIFFDNFDRENHSRISGKTIEKNASQQNS